jgi:hypothetical protein
MRRVAVKVSSSGKDNTKEGKDTNTTPGKKSAESDPEKFHGITETPVVAPTEEITNVTSTNVHEEVA